MAPNRSELSQSQRGKSTMSAGHAPRIEPAIPLSFGQKPKSKGRGPSDFAGTECNSYTKVASRDETESTSGRSESKGPAHTLNGLPRLEAQESGLKSLYKAADFVEEGDRTQQEANGVQPEAAGPVQLGANLQSSLVDSNSQPTPPFDISDDKSTPVSATSSTFSKPQSVQRHFDSSTAHKPKPSANGITFGGFQDSSRSSPVLNASPGAGPYMNFQYAPVTPSMQNHFVPPPFAPYGVNQHFSTPQPYPSFPRASSPVPQQNPHMQAFPRAPARAGPSQSWLPHGAHAPYRGHSFEPRQQSPANGFVNDAQLGSPPPAAGPLQANDFRQHALKSPSPLQDDHGDRPHETAPVAMREDAAARYSQRRHSTFGLPMPGQPSPSRPEFDVAPHLRDYILLQFHNPDFADTKLEFTFEHDQQQPLILPAHALILSQSPALAQSLRGLKQQSTSSDGEVRKLSLSVSHRFINGFALSEVLRHLYGGPLLDLPAFPQGPESKDLRRQMEFALAYAASGHFLQLDPIIIRGLDIATNSLSWETVEQAVDFALDGGVGPKWASGDVPGHSRSGSSSNGYQQEGTLTSGPLSKEYSAQFLKNIIEFIVYIFPKDFQLSTSASESPKESNFSAIAGPKGSTHKSQLSHIKFGEVPVEWDSGQSSTNAVLSRILTRLPVIGLKYLLEHYGLGGRLGWPKVVEHMNAIIAERTNLGRQLPGGAEAGRWEARMEPDSKHPTGFRIVRQQKDEAAPLNA